MINFKVGTISYFIALFATFLIEMPIVYLLFHKVGFFKGRKLLLSAFIAQLITHPLFFSLIPFVTFKMRPDLPLYLEFIYPIYIREMIIPLIEGVYYLLYLKPSKGYYAFTFSFIANISSWGLGYMVPHESLIELII